MLLCKVVGTVYGAKQSGPMHGWRVVELRPLTTGDIGPIHDDPPDEALAPSSLLAIDPLGADEGQLVLVAIGSRVRDLCLGPDATTKHVVVAIVDAAEVVEGGQG